MALTDFFRITMPYGISRNDNGEWFAFNREYQPVGWNSKAKAESISGSAYQAEPIYTKYKALTESKLLKIAGGEEMVKRDDAGTIIRIFLYNDKTNPTNNSKYWDAYVEKIKLLSSLQVA